MYHLANIFATADDLGLNHRVNEAIAKCFEKGYINSTSLLTTTAFFIETIELLRAKKAIKNIGIHVNFAEGKPLTNFKSAHYLTPDGYWDISRTNKKIAYLNQEERAAFALEIEAQINKAYAAGVKLTHIDSHYHLHTLPMFFNLFLEAAKRHKLPVRMAQTFNEGNYIKYGYRLYINNTLKRNKLNYTNRFETIGHFLENKGRINDFTGSTELMLHPDIDENGNLTDHFEGDVLTNWISFLETNNLRLANE
jgi:predicted glycoside hydrolase/deacetylase ChbG (UPF0249 family)